MNTIMVTGIKSISQQQVSAMGLNGLSAATVSQMPSQEVPVKRSTASDTRRVSVALIDSQLKIARLVNDCKELWSNFLFAPVLTICDSNSYFYWISLWAVRRMMMIKFYARFFFIESPTTKFFITLLDFMMTGLLLLWKLFLILKIF